MELHEQIAEARRNAPSRTTLRSHFNMEVDAIDKDGSYRTKTEAKQAVKARYNEYIETYAPALGSKAKVKEYLGLLSTYYDGVHR